MDYEFLNMFQPLIIGVSNRTERFWENKNYYLERRATRSHILAYVYSGEGEIVLGGNRFSLRSGALFYIPPESQMKLRTQKNCLLNFYSILFHYGQLRWEGDSIQWKHDIKNPIYEKEVTYFEESPMLLDIYSNMFRVWARKGIGYEWKAKWLFQQLLDVLIQMIHNLSGHQQRNVKIIEDTIEYIQNHLHRPLVRHMLAERACLSKSHFSIIFKQHTGYSPSQFITRIRLDRAKQLLRETNMPIYKISEEIGYTDSFYFTRQFRKDTGMSPREFRKYFI